MALPPKTVAVPGDTLYSEYWAVIGYLPLATWVADAGSFVGAAAAFLVLAGAVRTWYRRTLGRRRDRYERLGRLGTGAHLSFFESVLGEPPAMRRSYAAEVKAYSPEIQDMVSVERLFLECFFIDRDYYVQAICDEDASVIAFSVTTRSKRFRPIFSFPPKPSRAQRRRWKEMTGESFKPFFRIALGRTRFEALGQDEPSPQRKAETGARTFSYTELYYFGNPGNYQSFGFTASSAAHQAEIGPIGDVVEELGRDWVGGVGEEDSPQLAGLAGLRAFRHETPVTTYTVLGSSVGLDQYPGGFGPHGDEVRTLP